MFTVSITHYCSQNKEYVIWGPFDGPSALKFARTHASPECWITIQCNNYSVLLLESGKEISFF